MLRTLTLTAAAAVLIAAPASAQSIRVSMTGKSPAQVKAQVRQAAEALCRQETVGSLVEFDAQRVCVEHTMRKTLAQAPQLSTYAAR